MIPHGVEIFVGLEPIDLRWSFDRLAGIVSERIGREARSGALFVFFGKRHDALKVLFFDGTGMCVFYKRLLCGGPHKSLYAKRDVMRGRSRRTHGNRISATSTLRIITAGDGPMAPSLPCRRAATRSRRPAP